MEFRYRARTAAGAAVHGRLDAPDVDAAVAGLRRRALFITAVEPVNGNSETARWRIALGGRRARVALFRSFATLVRAGVPLRRGLHVVIERSEHPRLRRDLGAVLADVERGEALSTSFAGRPGSFSPLVVAMVRAGESGGMLDEALERVALLLERDESTRKTVVAALAYPAAVLGGAIALVAFIVVRVIPSFATLFASFHVALPLSTRVLIALGEAAARPSTLIALSALLGLVALMMCAAGRTAAGRLAFDRVRLSLPLAGRIFRAAIAARLTRMLGTLVQSGVELSAALDIVTPVTGSPVHRSALGHVASALREGQALTAPLAATGLFDSMLLALTGVGEESGTLDAMLLRAADYYEADVAAALATLGAVLEPALIVVLGLVVGTIVYSVFIPLYSLIGSVSQ